ncbi:hypothetical protein CROQUDRAFT_672321 [Cronartium quercuum f. sp. fusiforme G11]|uniref:Ubiquinol-cytochrome c chaperone domain-containing protein n=1 Tax=Cronartium quercuum f. sp. fusiforme G11 TaxID=708437 RepID=A0A9P6NI16_9BASI|nr:hypothetical protein CROQUDRAFT_672321 [Cronartium quercuum f. sp. fusiforme G11]
MNRLSWTRFKYSQSYHQLTLTSKLNVLPAYLPSSPSPLLISNLSTATSPTPQSNNGSHHVVGRSGKTYSPTIVKLITTLGKLLGYNLRTSHAITLTSDYYDHCAGRFEVEKAFWVSECGLPDSFQSWFQVTQLHMWLLTVRLRAMRQPLGNVYVQELVNHAFIDTEHRIRAPPHKVTKSTLVKGYMRTMLHQHYGAQTGLDWALVSEDDSDAFLAAAVWRNIFGAEWGRGMGGVKGLFKNGGGDETKEVEYSFESDSRFPEQLERVVVFIRSELVRLNKISDEEITGSQGQGSRLIQFGKL